MGLQKNTASIVLFQAKENSNIVSYRRMVWLMSCKKNIHTQTSKNEKRTVNKKERINFA